MSDIISDFILQNKVILSALITVLLGFLSAAVMGFLGRYYKVKKTSLLPAKDTANKLKFLTTKLNEISAEIENTTKSLSSDINFRHKELKRLIKMNESLAQEEANLNAKVSVLKEIPVEVADYFKAITEEHLEKFDRRNRKRDILMFFLGTGATTIVSFIIALFIK